LACDEIVLVDDRSSSVSLPEVPLLGVLPGTGGLTRITDKRKVRHDLADIFCTSVEGVRGKRAVEWRLVDAVVKPAQFGAYVQERATALGTASSKPVGVKGVSLSRIEREETPDSLRYEYVTVDIDRVKRTATFKILAPSFRQPASVAEIEAAGVNWWPLAMTRQFDDAILMMRTNELDIGTWLLKTEGDAAAVLASDALLLAHQDHWLARETLGAMRRTFARIDVSSRSLFALIEPGSCFAGSLAELAFAADRTYMLALPDDADRAPKLTLGEMNFGPLIMVNDQSRLQRRFHEEAAPLTAAREAIGTALDADQALALGLVTAAPDDIDWADEIRIAIEERASMSPDALTGLEANLRFAGKENMATRIFGRLTAWQNWIFQRPNAVGDKGALKVYGKGDKAQFDLNRV
jgi:benzoyl-CoA-dihydrodiol lyase